MVLCGFVAARHARIGRILSTGLLLKNCPANLQSSRCRTRDVFTSCMNEVLDDSQLYASQGQNPSRPENKRSSVIGKSQTKWCPESWKDVLDQLNSPEIQLSISTCASLLKWCANVKALGDGKLIHEHIIKRGFEESIFLGNHLMHMYDNCGALECARALFERMHQRDLYSWNLMMKANSRQGQTKLVLQNFEQLQEEGLLPDQFIFLSILSVCAVHPALDKGKQMLVRISSSDFETDVLVGTALISVYGKCGNLDEAQKLFDKMPQKDSVSWNAMIAVYVHHGQNKDAFQLFDQMQLKGLIADRATFISMLSACGSQMILTKGKQMHAQILETGFQADVIVGTALVNMYGKCSSLLCAWGMFNRMTEHNNVTFINMLSACASHAALAEGKQLHDYIVKNGYECDVVVGTAVINMYGKCGSLEDAAKVFHEMPERNIVSWNAMTAACAQNGYAKYVIQLFAQMLREAVLPDKVTFVSILDACAQQRAPVESARVHACIVGGGVESDVVLQTALVNMYGKLGKIKDAQIVFDLIPQQDVTLWNAMIATYCQNEHDKDAFKLFKQMQQEGVIPDKVTSVNILSASANQTVLMEGKRLHSQFIFSGFEFDVFVHNALINMYGKCGSVEAAMNVFDKMLEWDKVTFVGLLSACASQAAQVEGKQIHVCIEKSGFNSVVVGNALVSMYGKCGSLECAQRVFDKMLERDVVSWTALIAVYAQHGYAKDALQLFQEMQGDRVLPNAVTFITVLSACSHGGLLHEGYMHFVSMTRYHGIVANVDHCNCMIDILGRAGRLEEAENLMYDIQPTVVSWMTLLGACRYQVDVERAEHAAMHVFDMDSENAAPYVMLSNIYTDAGREDDAVQIMKRMKDKGIKKQPGRSSIEVNGKVHTFLADDQSHPQKNNIYAELQRLSTLMEASGYVPDERSVLHNWEEREHSLWGHSEKLALAFGLINTDKGTPLIITKNLRVCFDCHTAIKYISKIVHRDVMVRDAIRFHHIKDGVCSCADFW